MPLFPHLEKGKRQGKKVFPKFSCYNSPWFHGLVTGPIPPGPASALALLSPGPPLAPRRATPTHRTTGQSLRPACLRSKHAAGRGQVTSHPASAPVLLFALPAPASCPQVLQ